ncbi:unnamed protein product, partial [Leptidea sinapis]
TAQTFFTNSFE